MKKKNLQVLKNVLMIIVGSAMFALGFDLFLEPCGINCGGVSGIAMLIVYAFDTKWMTVGVLSALINIPLCFCGYKAIGKGFFFGSLLGMAVTSVCFDLFARIIPVPTMDPQLASLIGGVCVGVGLGIVFVAGASTGGVAIVARLLKLRFRNFPIGKIILVMDLCTAVATGLVYGEFTNTLYSAITLYLSSVIVDKVVYSMYYAKVTLIISDQYEDIAAAIDGTLDRGVTLLQGQGFYCRKDKYVLLSAVKRQQLAELKELVISIDPGAFIILQDARQVLGDGFKRYERYEL